MKIKPGLSFEQLDRISRSHKYRSIGLPIDTLTSLLLQETNNSKNNSEAISRLRTKLHHIVAPYLDALDYDLADKWIADLPVDPASTELKSICLQILRAHTSTRERIECLPGFFDTIFKITGKPAKLIDLACGLNPFFFPWMGLDNSVQYHAIDLHKPRIDLINNFFKKILLPELALHDDFLVHPPQMHADIVFLFKEAHRLEQRLRGCNLPLWRNLNTDWLLVSLPTQNLTGTHSLLDKHRKLIKKIMGNSSWHVEELLFPNEIVFCIQKIKNEE